MKKVLAAAAAALLCTMSSFAAWDKFPVIEDGKGEAEIEFGQNRQGSPHGHTNTDFKIRYSPLANLELMSKWGGDNYVLGARYQILPDMLSAGVDVGVPIPDAVWSFTPHAQFAMKFSEALSLGTNIEFTIPLEHSYSEYTDVMYLEAGAEIDFTIGQSTIWVGFDFGTGIGEDSNDVKAEDLNPPKGLKLSPAIGYLAEVSNLTLGTFVALDFGEKSGNDPFNTYIGITAAVKF